MRTKIEKVLEIATTEDLMDMFRECNSWDGYYQDMYCYDMDEFDELHSCTKPWEIARAITFGDFNATDDLWRYNAYGNLESLDQDDYEREIEYIKEEIVEHFIDLYERGNKVYCYNDEILEILDNEIFDLIDEFENAIENNDESQNELIEEIESKLLNANVFEDDEEHEAFLNYLATWMNWDELKEMIIELSERTY